MQITVYVPKTFTIPESKLAELARRAQRRGRGNAFDIRGAVNVEDLFEQARRDKLISVPADFATGGDEFRIYYRGRILEREEAQELVATGRKKKRSRASSRDPRSVDKSL